MERNTIELIQSCLLTAAALSFFVTMMLIMITCTVTVIDGTEEQFKKSLLMILISGVISLSCGIFTLLLNCLV